VTQTKQPPENPGRFREGAKGVLRSLGVVAAGDMSAQLKRCVRCYMGISRPALSAPLREIGGGLVRAEAQGARRVLPQLSVA
jgi:hypothetical protein